MVGTRQCGGTSVKDLFRLDDAPTRGTSKSKPPKKTGSALPFPEKNISASRFELETSRMWSERDNQLHHADILLKTQPSHAPYPLGKSVCRGRAIFGTVHTPGATTVHAIQAWVRVGLRRLPRRPLCAACARAVTERLTRALTYSRTSQTSPRLAG